MLKPSGDRLEDKQFNIIRKWARIWKVRNAVAHRNIITNFDEEQQRQKERKV